MNKPALRYVAIFGCIVVFMAVVYTPLFFVDDLRPLVQENGPYQTLTAVGFLLASIVLFYTYFSIKNGARLGRFTTKRNVFVLLLALMFFVGAGEEQSWGQHMLGFEPPEAIADANLQREFNLHNLPLFHGKNGDGTTKSGLRQFLTIGKLFSLFWLGFCVGIPLLNAVSSHARHLLGQVGMPIVPLWIGLAFPVNYAIAKSIAPYLDMPEQYITEVKEMNFGLLFMAFAIVYFRSLAAKRQTVDDDKTPAFG